MDRKVQDWATTAPGLRLFLTKFTPAGCKACSTIEPYKYSTVHCCACPSTAPLACLAGPPAMAIQSARPACRHSAMRCCCGLHCCTIEMTRRPSLAAGHSRATTTDITPYLFASTAVERTESEVGSFTRVCFVLFYASASQCCPACG